MPANNELFPNVQPGDPIKAEQWNLITQQLNRLSNVGDSAHVLATGAGTFLRTGKKRRQTTTTEDDDDGFPAGVDCDCDHCIEGITLPDMGMETDPALCCRDHMRRTMVSPWSAAPGTHDLKYITGQQWLTDPWDGPDCEIEVANEGECTAAGGTFDDPVCTTHNEYRWLVDRSTAPYTLSLVVETDNGCPVPCIVYKADAAPCQCDWVFTLNHPDAEIGGLGRDALTCNVCVKPALGGLTLIGNACPQCLHGIVSRFYAVEISGVTNGTCDDCEDDWNGTWILGNSISLAIGCFNNFCGWGGFNSQKNPPASGLNDCYVGDSASHLCFSIGLNNPGFFGGGGSSTGLPTLSATKFSIHTPNIAGAAVWRADPDEFPVGSDCTVPMTLYLVSETHPETCSGWPETITVTPVSADGSPLSPFSPTDDGRCGTPCAAAAAPTDPTTGGCCFEGHFYHFLDETECNTIGGTWFADDSAETGCEETGKCCLYGSVPNLFSCADSTESVCAAQGNLFAVAHFWSSTGDCPDVCPAIGACCDEGACEEFVFENECPGTFYEGQRCVDVEPCPAPEGCCTDDSTILPCESLTEAACLAAHPTGWTWTEGGTCDGTECIV